MASHLESALLVAEARRKRLFAAGEDGNLGAAGYLMAWLEVWGDRFFNDEAFARVEAEIEKYLECANV